jgi:hypothetical protein
VGKHETGYARVERDLYPTPPWVIAALAEHVDLHGLTVWEPACGDGRMVEALRAAGCASVYASDIADHGTADEVLDFLSAQMPKLERPPDAMITNPPFGQGGKLATAFIEAGLTRIRQHGGLLALLLPCDFDSAKTRALLRRLPVLRRQDRAADAGRLVSARRRNPRSAEREFGLVHLAAQPAAGPPSADHPLCAQRGSGAMTDILLMVIVGGAVIIALIVDIAALVGWLRGRWR